MKKIEFRLVMYMNAPESRGFYGGRAAASPLAFYFHIKKNKNVFLGGAFRLIGLGKYRGLIKNELEKNSITKLPKEININRETIIISDIAYIYQNFDPLLREDTNKISWKVKIDKIISSDKDKEPKYVLDAVHIGWKEFKGKSNHKEIKTWSALASKLDKIDPPFGEDKEFKVFGGNNKERNFWGDNGTPSIPRSNSFLHFTPARWKKTDKCVRKNISKLSLPKIIDNQIKNNRIHESLVHEMLKMLFAKEGWWINFEIPINDKKNRGRIDFLIKKGISGKDPWKVIEVKLGDNPNAVEQLNDYLRAIKRDVKKNKGDSNFWLLWNGKKGCKNIKGVILCAGGNETIKEANKYGFEVWKYKYIFKRSKLGIEIRNAKSDKIIFGTG